MAQLWTGQLSVPPPSLLKPRQVFFHMGKKKGMTHANHLLTVNALKDSLSLPKLSSLSPDPGSDCPSGGRSQNLCNG